MTDDFLSRIFINQWTVFILVSVVLLVLAEAGHRSAFSQIVFPMLIALVSAMDRPRRGLIGVSQEPLKELWESMQN